MKPFYTLTVQGRARRLRHLALVALKDYPIEVKRLRLISTGFNCTFRVDAHNGSRYFMRVGRSDKTASNLNQNRAEMTWLAALRQDTDLRVPAPVRTRDGGLLTSASVAGVPERRYCAVFGWLMGQGIDHRFTAATLEKFGALAAHLHQHAATWSAPGDFSPITFDRVFPFPVSMFDDEYRQIMPPDRRALFEQTIARVQAAYDRLKCSGEPPRVVHGDLHRWNVKMYRGQIAAFDFEELGWGWPIQDIGTTLYYFYGEPDYQNMLSAFKRGYTRIVPWPERYPGELELFIAGRGLMLANSILQDESPEVRTEAAAYFERTERCLRALERGEAFNMQYW